MATHEELAVIRNARAGHLPAQLELGKRYLFGSDGLPKSIDAAWHWFRFAARKESLEACILIGRNIPFELAQQAPKTSSVYSWYERAFDAGVTQAGLVLAKLVLTQSDQSFDGALQSKALSALSAAAHAGIAEAQWLLAQSFASREADGHHLAREWTIRAAIGGVTQAQYTLAEQAWAQADHAEFLRWALPLARAPGVLRQRVAPELKTSRPAVRCLTDQHVSLLSRCAQLLSNIAGSDKDEVERFWQSAANENDMQAQLSLGLWLARISSDGTSSLNGAAAPEYKRAIQWMTMAGTQGSSAAWYAMSRIYLKVGFSRRSVVDAQRCRENAAELGHCQAQFECGAAAWRARHQRMENELRAVYWLQKAVVQGCADAATLLAKIAVPATPAPWAQAALRQLPAKYEKRNGFVAARIELAACFGLSRAEALLIDLNVANQGFCLLVDLRAKYRCGKRRLILLETAQQRDALTRIAQVAGDFNCDIPGSEHVIRKHLQCLYRLGRQLAPADERVAQKAPLFCPPIKGNPRASRIVRKRPGVASAELAAA